MNNKDKVEINDILTSYRFVFLDFVTECKVAKIVVG